MRWAPWSSILFIVNYCHTRVLMYAKMLKETENEETRLFWQIFVIGGILIEGGPGPLGHSLATLTILRQDRSPNKFFYKKKHSNQNWNNFFSKPRRTRVKSLDSFLKRPCIALHYYDAVMWSLLLMLTFVRLNPKLKKLQFGAGTTYWLCSLYIYHW